MRVNAAEDKFEIIGGMKLFETHSPKKCLLLLLYKDHVDLHLMLLHLLNNLAKVCVNPYSSKLEFIVPKTLLLALSEQLEQI